jgi:hypothetical protein
VQTKTFFYSENRGLRLPRRKQSKGGGAGHQTEAGKRSRSIPHLEQPTPNQEGAEPCRLCGFPVEPKRMHFHMVRVHGATLLHKGGCPL